MDRPTRQVMVLVFRMTTLFGTRLRDAVILGVVVFSLLQVHVGHFVRRDNRAGQADWTNLYVKGLPSSWDDAKLREEFEKHGAVTSCKVQVAPQEGGEESKDKEKEKGSEGGKSRGFGFVNFEEHDAAVKAIEAFNGTVSD